MADLDELMELVNKGMSDEEASEFKKSLREVMDDITLSTVLDEIKKSNNPLSKNDAKLLLEKVIEEKKEPPKPIISNAEFLEFTIDGRYKFMGLEFDKRFEEGGFEYAKEEMLKLLPSEAKIYFYDFLRDHEDKVISIQEYTRKQQEIYIEIAGIDSEIKRLTFKKNNLRKSLKDMNDYELPFPHMSEEMYEKLTDE